MICKECIDRNFPAGASSLRLQMPSMKIDQPIQRDLTKPRVECCFWFAKIIMQSLESKQQRILNDVRWIDPLSQLRIHAIRDHRLQPLAMPLEQSLGSFRVAVPGEANQTVGFGFVRSIQWSSR